MRRAAPASAAVALVTLVWVALHFLWYAHGVISDVKIYKIYGNAMVHRHEVPYRDFRLEYPPAALPVFALPSLTGAYLDVFQGLMGVCHLAIVLTVLRLRGRLSALLAVLAPLLLGSVTATRFDLWPTALAAGALLLFARGRTSWAAVVLATGFAAKLWPVVLAPLFCIWLWRTAGPRAVARWAAVAVATAAVWFVPFLIVGLGGVAHSFYLQLARPLQIESLGGVTLVFLHSVLGLSIGVVSNFGSQNVVGGIAHAVSLATSAVEAVAVIAVCVLFARRERTTDALFVACAAIVTALMAFGKVFSPQYLLWLIPFVPLTRRAAAVSLYVMALVLTQVYFPKRYWDYASGLHRVEVGIVGLRDLAVVALFAVLAYALKLERAASRSAVSVAVN